MTRGDTEEWRSELLRKIGGYGVSDRRLLEIAAAICRKELLTEEQRLYAVAFEERLQDPYSVRGQLA